MELPLKIADALADYQMGLIQLIRRGLHGDLISIPPESSLKPLQEEYAKVVGQLLSLYYSNEQPRVNLFYKTEDNNVGFNDYVHFNKIATIVRHYKDYVAERKLLDAYESQDINKLSVTIQEQAAMPNSSQVPFTPLPYVSNQQRTRKDEVDLVLFSNIANQSLDDWRDDIIKDFGSLFSAVKFDE